MDKLEQELKEHLIYFRSERGLDQKTIAELLNVSPSDITALFSKENERVSINRMENTLKAAKAIRRLIDQRLDTQMPFLRIVQGLYRGFWCVKEVDSATQRKPLLMQIDHSGSVRLKSTVYEWHGLLHYYESADSLECYLTTHPTTKRRAFMKGRLERFDDASKPCNFLAFAFISDYQNSLLFGKAAFFRYPDTTDFADIAVEDEQNLPKEMSDRIDKLFKNEPNSLFFDIPFIGA